MKWKKTLKKIGVFVLKLIAVVGTALVVIKHIADKMGMTTESEKNKKIKDKIRTYKVKADETIKDVEADTEEVEDSHSSVKDNMANREEQEGKFFN